MTQGVECWNASGQKTLDISSRIAKFFGIANIGYTTTGTAGSGTITDTRFTSYTGTIPFAFVIQGGVDFNFNTATFTFSGNVLTWTFLNASADNASRPPTTFVYGVL
jgi:hypothetical protein